ncbi:alpha/beta hydrolase [Paenibacillus sp. KN14-4R]|uniref:alpha/beta hydrolase n=1 Tax=Paenibacillus sp. KN14-4R TaxID=3445773 RepID=UPI003F9F0ACB
MDNTYYTKRTIVKHIIPSNYLGANRPIRIYLPPGYSELLSYPVIYCQDGEQFFNFGRIATFLTQGILDEGMEPAIVVGVDVDTSIRTAEYAPNGHLHASYLSFFTEELIPWVEENYSVRTTSDERILAGDSLGGTVSLHLAIHYRDLFSKVISFSGAFFLDTRQALQEQEDLSWLDLYMLIGLDETSVETERGTFDFVEENRATKEILEQKKTKLLYIEKPGHHLWGFWQKEMMHALKHFLA